MLELFDDQKADVDAIRAAYRRGKRRPLYVLPTGGGKTVVFSYIIKSAIEKGKRALVLVHRRELLSQALDKLRSLGLQPGAIAAGHTFNPFAQVQVASVQTLIRRLHIRWEPDLIVVDEGHHANAKTWSTILGAWPQARVLGVTATPVDSTGRGLGHVYDHMVKGLSVAELMQRGRLSDYKLYIPPQLVRDEEIAKRGKDFDPTSIETLMNKPSITGDAIAHYERICPGASSVVFCATVKHAKDVAAQFSARGWKFVAIDGQMDVADRDAALADLGAGRIHGITSCEVISEGTDIPAVQVAIMLRHTQSLRLFLQQAGRVLRLAKDKPHAIILDHVGHTKRFGLVDDDRDWALEMKPEKKKKKPVEKVRVWVCEQCYCANAASWAACAGCGAEKPKAARAEAEAIDGTLVEIDKAAMRAALPKKPKNPAELQEWLELAEAKGYKKQWAYMQYGMRKRKWQAKLKS